MPNQSNVFQLGEVRRLNQILRDGGPDTFNAYRELVGLLLRSTVMHEHGAIKLIKRANDPSRATIGGRTPLDPVPLTNGHYLRLSAFLYLDPEPPYYLKVAESSYQYQRDRDGSQWVFRYDYLRTQQGAIPPAHIQIRGELTERTHVDAPELKDIHFATGRVSLEAAPIDMIQAHTTKQHIPVPREQAGKDC